MVGNYLRQQLDINLFYNESVFSLISNWFDLPIKSLNDKSMFQPQMRFMNDLELMSFGLETPQTCLTSLQIRLKNQIYHAEGFKRVDSNKRCSFITSYIDNQVKKYCKILYFLQYNNRYFIAANELVPNAFTALNEIKGRKDVQIEQLKNDGAFNDYFIKTKLQSSQMYFISSEKVESICLLQEKNENFYYLADFICEHD